MQHSTQFCLTVYTGLRGPTVRNDKNKTQNTIALCADARGNRFTYDLLLDENFDIKLAYYCHEISFMLFWISTVSSGSPVQWYYIILTSKIFIQRLLESLCQLLGFAEEKNVIFDGFADNLAKKNDSLIHYFLLNPACDLIVQISLQGSIFCQILSHISRVSSSIWSAGLP